MLNKTRKMLEAMRKRNSKSHRLYFFRRWIPPPLWGFMDLTRAGGAARKSRRGLQA